MVSRAPVYHILWVRGFRALPFPGADSIFSSRCGAISGRLHFAVTPSRAAIPGDRNTSVQKIDDSARRSPLEQRSKNKYRTTAQLWQEIC